MSIDERILAILNSDDRDNHAKDVEAILAEFVVIPRTKMVVTEEWVERRPGFGHTAQVINGERTFSNSSLEFWEEQVPTEWASAVEAVTYALKIEAVRDYFRAAPERKAAIAAAAAEAKRNARRDGLATELVAAAYGDSEFDRKFDRLSPEMKQAIDRIIELEDAAS